MKITRTYNDNKTYMTLRAQVGNYFLTQEYDLIKEQATFESLALAEQFNTKQAYTDFMQKAIGATVSQFKESYINDLNLKKDKVHAIASDALYMARKIK